MEIFSQLSIQTVRPRSLLRKSSVDHGLQCRRISTFEFFCKFHEVIYERRGSSCIEREHLETMQIMI